MPSLSATASVNNRKDYIMSCRCNNTNDTLHDMVGSMETITGDDAAWLLSCAFLIFTMQTGFAMLECGCVSAKNTANIMVKNVVDVSIGGLGFWAFGYALSFGDNATPFIAYNNFFFNAHGKPNIGTLYIKYFFQLSFATTATTIVSGAVAERMRLDAYMAFSFVNNLVYCLPAEWAWNEKGWLKQLGFYDFAGVCVVHMCGGVSALIAAVMLGPRLNRFENPEKFQMSSPVTAMTGMFMLWWAWLAFNCGSAFGISNGLWRISAHVAVTTLNAATGGGITGILLSYFTKKGKISIHYIINSVLGGLVSVTGIAPLTTTAEALPIGIIGALIAIGASHLIEKLGIDDPVGATPVHLCAGLWGIINVGILAAGSPVDDDLNKIKGLIHGGGARQLGVQLLGCIAIMAWSALVTFVSLTGLKYTIGIRMDPDEEILGADWVEHELRQEMVSNELETVMKELDNGQLKKLILSISKNDRRIGTASTIDDHNRIFGVEHNISDANKHDEFNRQIMIDKQIANHDNSDKMMPNSVENFARRLLKKVAITLRLNSSVGPTNTLQMKDTMEKQEIAQSNAADTGSTMYRNYTGLSQDNQNMKI